MGRIDRRAPSRQFRQERAVDVFHHDEQPIVGVGDFVNRADVWMIQRGRCARFIEKPAARGFDRLDR